MKTVRVLVTKNGEVTIEAMGYKGVGCEAVTRYGENGLGGKTLKDEQKPEYFETPAAEGTSAGGF